LAIQGADIDAAKTNMSKAHALLTPRSRMIVKPTGPALYRLIDHARPTLYIDNADKLLARDRDLAYIVNSSWTRGILIPRTMSRGQVYEFDPFSFKILNGVDILPHLDPATRSRCIVTEMLPKLAGEEVIDFKHTESDERFAVLRRKAARWFADNMAALQAATPVMPAGFNNRLAKNYELLFAIADLAGGDWPKRARAAAIKLSREYNAPSMGRRLLAIFYALFSRYGPLLTSEQVERALPSYGDEWANYRNQGRPISKWQIAELLRPFKIAPGVIHPRGHRADRGYDVAWFEVAFRHYLGKGLPVGRTVVRRRRKK
jgi:putative DNA primase/helicase